MEPSPTERPAWSEIDLDALAHNVRTIRAMLPDEVRFYAVCKNNAYGCGARETARTMLAAGADAFAVSDPEDAQRLRRVANGLGNHPRTATIHRVCPVCIDQVVKSGYQRQRRTIQA